MRGDFAFILLMIFATPSHAFGGTPVMKLGPPEIAEALQKQSDDVLRFVVRGSPAGLTEARKMAASHAGTDHVDDLELIDGVGIALRAGDARELSQRTDISQVWYLHRSLYDEYVNIIKSMEYISRTAPPPTVINISLGPPSALMPMQGHMDEPMNAATRIMAERGYIPILAIGNYYTPAYPNPGVVSPWCLPDWVICVGAANEKASTLYAASARGLRDKPETWPDVVANGVDVIGPKAGGSGKSADQRHHDEGNTHFLETIPNDKRDLYTLMSGTSQATAQVSRAAGQIVYFLRSVMQAAPHVKPGGRLFILTIPHDRSLHEMDSAERITGEVGASTDEGVEVTYRMTTPWKLVKQLLIDTALPMPGFHPSEVGNGFVDPRYVEDQFGFFGRARPKILSAKAVP